ncbi:HPr kinase/phosphorylase [Pacificoceanicola onchidii]|uniref:HPr kinase/phosphorylase n=1 Tax=Pacificoceanicola onchidii TaxID=2562685 RepID=UPI001F0EDADB|nr:HPr kinase/phosphatase C-terminal domain-containing protein [Pacificoceanicola onchidii]
MNASGGPTILHASAVSVDGKGLLIRGKSGSGKSSLALELMTRGALLIADDRVIVEKGDAGAVWMRSPDAIFGMIEARGVGLLKAAAAEKGRLCAVLDLDCVETERLPEVRTTEVLGENVPLLHNSASSYFAAAILQYLKGGRKD